MSKTNTTRKKKGKKMQSQNLGKMRVNKKCPTVGQSKRNKKYKNDRRLQRQLKQANQLKEWS